MVGDRERRFKWFGVWHCGCLAGKPAYWGRLFIIFMHGSCFVCGTGLEVLAYLPMSPRLDMVQAYGVVDLIGAWSQYPRVGQ